MTNVYLVGKNDLFRVGVKSLLERNDFKVAGEYNTIAELQKAASGDTAPLIINIYGDSEGFAEKVLGLKQAYSNGRVVVISSRTEMPAIMPALSSGIDGYILKDITCEALIGSLRLVVAGEKVYPTFVLNALSKQASKPIANDAGSDAAASRPGHQLSMQELRIVHCLAQGDPNKIIAHSLNISEATVKVHVKTILRKLGVRNRTQAALWATARGLVQFRDPAEQAIQQASF